MSTVKLNEIQVLTKTPNTNIAIGADLYDIESTNTTEVRTQSVSTAEGNEHTIEKSSIEGLIATKIVGGTLEFVAPNNNTTLAYSPFLLIDYISTEQ